jgi:zinc transport system ATP-binding protein
MSALVTIRNMCVSLGGWEVLKGLDAEICHGHITAILGLNGSGKTTLLRALLKEVPSTGQVTFHCGHDHSRLTPEYVGYVPQKLHLDTTLPITVRDLFGIALQRRPIFLGIPPALTRLMKAMLLQVGARAELIDSPVASLSGGEKQRVLLALAMQPNPELLLLDEPAAGIDFQDQQKFYDLIAQLNRERGVTIVLVSHDTSVVTKYAHHVLCLRDGTVRCQGAPEEIMKPDMLEQVFGANKALYPHQH